MNERTSLPVTVQSLREQLSALRLKYGNYGGPMGELFDLAYKMAHALNAAHSTAEGTSLSREDKHSAIYSLIPGDTQLRNAIAERILREVETWSIAPSSTAGSDAPKQIIDPPGAAVEMFRRKHGRLPNRPGDHLSLTDRLELAAQACHAAHLLSCETTCREAAVALSARDVGCSEEQEISRRIWHRQCGLEGKPCPSEYDCEAFDIGFSAGVANGVEQAAKIASGYLHVHPIARQIKEVLERHAADVRSSSTGVKIK